MRRQLLNTTFYNRIAMASDMGGGGGGGQQQPVDSGGTGGNQLGNSDAGGNKSGTQDNTAPAFDAASFWKQPEPAADKSPAAGSADSRDAGSGAQSYAQEFNAKLTGMSFADIFTPEVAEQVSKGDMSGVNKGITDQLREGAKQSVIMAAQLMQKNNEALEARIQAKIDAAFGNRDNSDTLVKNFPGAADPAMRPVFEGVFNQALKLANGDRGKAVEATKNMLQYMGNKGAADMGITTPAGGPSDSYNSSAATDLVAELLGR